MKASKDKLIITYLTEEISTEEQASLLKWLEESDENKRYFRTLKDVYDLGHMDLDMQRSEVDVQWAKFLNKIFPYRMNNPEHFRTLLMRYVAIFLLGLVCMGIINRWQKKEELVQGITKIETGVGERSKIYMPDGSTVWVNACSSITYDHTFGIAERIVDMKGEAYFEVKKDKTRPFLVRTDKFTFRVTGTSFNVYSFEGEDEISIALIEGSVIVEHAAGKELLKPGEMFIYNKCHETTERKKITPGSCISWRYGEMFFDEITFEDLAHRLERNFNVKFKFERSAIKEETLNGSFHKTESLETVLKVIGTSIPIKYIIDKDTVYIK
ncbi:FecR family protein [Parabacteroides pacaensis]|uniref:FecR family protein n=1 Tax=Parabacteroides pacaensis TaxID=2086575 RepID=UPI000D107123|nr:FecR domain-containing protein [Parabacteroides pacaensis]